jgi:hypothetical protein
MVDLQFAICARQQRVPILAIGRPEGWLTFLEREGLWEQNRSRITHHTYAMRAHAPWDFESFRAIYSELISRVPAGGHRRGEPTLDPAAQLALKSGETPRDWCVTPDSIRARARYLEIAVD